jgi:hypothetical protein
MCNQLCRVFSAVGIIAAPEDIDLHVTAVNPAQLLQFLSECREAVLSFLIVCVQVHEHADTPHSARLLRPSRE